MAHLLLVVASIEASVTVLWLGTFAPFDPACVCTREIYYRSGCKLPIQAGRYNKLSTRAIVAGR